MSYFKALRRHMNVEGHALGVAEIEHRIILCASNFFYCGTHLIFLTIQRLKLY